MRVICQSLPCSDDCLGFNKSGLSVGTCESRCHRRVGRVTLDCLKVEASTAASFVSRFQFQILTEPVVWFGGGLGSNGS